MKNLVRITLLTVSLLQAVPALAQTTIAPAPQIDVAHQRASLELQLKTFDAVQTPSAERRVQLLAEIIDVTAEMKAQQRLAVVKTLISTLEVGKTYAGQSLTQKRVTLIAADVILALITMRGFVPSQKNSVLRVLSGVAAGLGVLAVSDKLAQTVPAEAALDMHAQLLLNELRGLQTAAETAVASEQI